ncbi:hypothetical protein NKH72_08175 [Mesorhizobium sp. M0955]|uniref:hypothetical protein n=1 Tax=unclassified Mesorhizobium TaxID=325217 RepID=UPI00333D68BE
MSAAFSNVGKESVTPSRRRNSLASFMMGWPMGQPQQSSAISFQWNEETLAERDELPDPDKCTYAKNISLATLLASRRGERVTIAPALKKWVAGPFLQEGLLRHNDVLQKHLRNRSVAVLLLAS